METPPRRKRNNISLWIKLESDSIENSSASLEQRYVDTEDVKNSFTDSAIGSQYYSSRILNSDKYTHSDY